ncbi:MAG: hypothetical protein Q4Q07_06750 [Tissierellia bacterium]|nr:hypothetical protein [Tissierellia bacterium]
MDKRRARRRRVEKRRRLIFLVLILLLIPLLIQGILIKNRLIRLKIDDVEYVEFIKFPENKMVTIKNPKKLKRIIRKINGFSGSNVGSQPHTDKEVSFVNVYTKSHGKVELTKTDEYIGVNGNWYKVRSKYTNEFDKFFQEYF